ncbi:hypothetical protein [Nesterenkonia ebinurensis]|uniref:hypothetical protein n=1 Tax=Nesterenkonia ebinurensis TaxID=2608252 RepID=UPI00123DECC4|nr:hypothetical protein [Nesterenkonia ebinurensis]
MSDTEGLSIAIYSDPGRTSMFLRRILGHPDQSWAQGASITHHEALIPLRSDATLDLDEALAWAQKDEAELTIIVTEIPRMAKRRPKTLELHFADRLGVISLPSLGPAAIHRSLCRELARAVKALTHDSVEEAEHPPEKAAAQGQNLIGRVQGGFGSRVMDQQGRETVYITPREPFPGRLWMTLGMVAANEPLRSLRKLSKMFSAAAATGAFGIFFTTIWEMATFLPSWRLGAVTVAAVVVLVLWLIVSNRLWDRSHTVGGKREAFMYNASTLTSLAVSVGLLYLGLFTAILGAGLLLIDPEFMTETIGEEASFANYADIAWLSASMGTVAGAIGSNFDDDADLRNLTQGSRELQRYPS